MADKRSVKITDLGKVITQELTLYAEDVTRRVDKIGLASVREIVRITKDTAPFDARAYHQHYADLIACKEIKKRATGNTYVWYVQAPGHRLTHLLVKGHETRDGGRSRSDPFLQNACDKVLPEYEAAIERTIRNGK